MVQNQSDHQGDDYSQLRKAAEDGDIELLYKLLGRDPSILEKVDRQFTENPLHVAVSNKQMLFAAEIANLNPSFARKLNQHGWSPLHIAAEKGQVEIVKKLLEVVDKELCFIKGREMMTPLHCAARSDEPGSGDVIIELLSASPKCISSFTTKKETALHTAVKSGRYENFEALVEWITKERAYNNLSWKDQDGNTPLHLAASGKQEEHLKMVELLLCNYGYFFKKAVKVNEMNASRQTALDVLIKENEMLQIIVEGKAQGDEKKTDVQKMQKILKHAGAKRSQDSCLTQSQKKPSKSKTVLHRGLKWFLKVPQFLSFKVDKDTPSDVRNALLVIFVLIVAVTYQTGVSPPGGLWQDGPNNNGSISINNNSTLHQKIAGKSVWFDQNPSSFQVLMLCNYAGFLVSVVLVFNLTEGYPLRGPTLLALLFMLVTYGLSIRLLFLDLVAVPGAVALMIRFMVFTVPLPVALVLLVATANWIWEIK